MKASIISLSYIYICSIRYHGTFLMRPDQQDVHQFCQSVAVHLQVKVLSTGYRLLLQGFRLQLAWVLWEQQMVVLWEQQMVVLWEQWVHSEQLPRLREW